MRSAFVVLAVFVLSALFAAAADSASVDSVAQAVESAMGPGSATQASATTLPAKPEFANDRIADINKRMQPFNQPAGGQGPQNKQQGYGPNGGGQGFGGGPMGPNSGGQGFDPRGGPGFGGDNFGPQGDSGFGGGQDFGPQGGKQDFGPRGGPDFGGGFGGGPNFGPKMDSPFGPRMDFDLPPEAMEGFIFGEIGDKMIEKYGEENLMSKCGSQPELVDLALKELQSSGLNLQEEFCSQMEDGLERCEEGKKMCEQIGPEHGPSFGPPDEEGNEFVATCPPNKDQILAVCKKRMVKQFAEEQSRREEDMDLNCEQRWEFEQPRFQMECEGGQLKLPPFCDRGKFINECAQRQQGWQQPQQPWDQQQQQPQQQPYVRVDPGQQQVQRCGPGPQLPQEWFDSCTSGGGWVNKKTDDKGCVINIECATGQRPSAQQGSQPPQGQQQPWNQQPWQQQPQQGGQQCPSNDELERKKSDCINSGGRWNGGNDGRCPFISCMMPPQGPQPQQQPGVQPDQPQQPWQPPQQPGVQPGQQPPQTQQPPAQQPEPSPAAAQQPASIPAASIQAASAPFTGFFDAPSPQQACEQEWSRNEQMFNRQCEQHKSRGGNVNICDKGSFLSSCRQEELKRMGENRQRLNFDRICEIEVKRFTRDIERFCKDSQRGKDQCKKETERGCEFVKKQIIRCKEMTSADRIRDAVTKAVAKKCKYDKNRRRVEVRPINLDEVPQGEVLPAIVATKEGISPEEARQLEQAVQRVEGYSTLSGLRIYHVQVKASDFSNLKKLPFVTDAKVDPIARSLNALEQREGRMSGLDRAATALQAAQDLAQSSDQRNLIDYEADNVVQAKEKIDELAKDKGIGYGLQQVLGMKAEQEKKEAEDLKAESERLSSTIGRLKQLSEQVDDVSLQAVLLEQIRDLEAQQKSIQSKADAKKKGAAGLFSLFGLLG